MFKSTGNNFGGPQITFKDYQSEHEIVLNAVFDYDSTNEAYRKARQLEIYVPDLKFSKSAVAGCFFAATYEDGDIGTTVRTWIKNRNTIVIEKLTTWDNYTNHRIYICTMYGLRGFRNVQFEQLKPLGISLQQSESIGYPSDQIYYETKDWVFLIFSLGEPNWNVKGKHCFLSSYRDFPEDIDAVLPYVSGMHHNGEPGMNILQIQMKEGQILIPPLPQGMSTGTGWDSMFYAFIVRERDKASDTPGRSRWDIESLMAEKYSRGSVENIEMSGYPSMISASIISSYYGKGNHTYELEEIPESMLGCESFLIGSHLTGKCMTLQLAHIKFENLNNKKSFTITASAGGSALTFRTFDTSAAMPTNQ